MRIFKKKYTSGISPLPTVYEEVDDAITLKFGTDTYGEFDWVEVFDKEEYQIHLN